MGIKRTATGHGGGGGGGKRPLILQFDRVVLPLPRWAWPFRRHGRCTFFLITGKRHSLFLNHIWTKQDTFKIGKQLLQSFSTVNSEHKFTEAEFGDRYIVRSVRVSYSLHTQHFLKPLLFTHDQGNTHLKTHTISS